MLPPYNPSYPYPPQQGHQQQAYSQLAMGYPLLQRSYYPAPAVPSAIQYQQQPADQSTVIHQPTVIRQASVIRKPIRQPIVHRATVICQSESKPQINHELHLFITLFIFPPWIFVWFVLCLDREDSP